MKKEIKMSENKKQEKSGYSLGEMFLLAATGIIPGMIIIWAYKKFIKGEE